MTDHPKRKVHRERLTEDRDMLIGALGWARKGYPIFPCKPEDKSPLTRNGFKDATTDESKIRNWWRLWPSAMIGMPTGSVSGVDVLDIDVKLEEGINGFEHTPHWESLSPLIVETPSDGVHLWFQSEGKVRSSTDHIAPGVDTRGEGGYVIVPPSFNAEGSYRYLKGKRALDRLQPFPPDLLEQLAALHDGLGSDDPQADPRLITAALKVIPNPDLGWDDWKTMGMAIWRGTGGSAEGLASFDEWSRKSSRYDAQNTAKEWEKIARSPPTRIGAGAIFYRARRADPDWLTGVLDAVVLLVGAPLESAKKFVRLEYARENVACLVYYRGGFYEWTGSHYAESDNHNLRSKVYEFLEKADVCGGNKLAPFNPTPSKVSAVIDALRALVAADARKDVPFWLVADPVIEGAGTDGLVAFRNGILDVATRTVHPHSPHLFNINSLPFDYDPDAPSPTGWLDFLTEIWPREVDQEAQQTLQEIFGLSLTGNTSFQKIFMIAGPKRSGKGTIARVLRGMLGNANVAAPTLASLASEFGLAPLINKRIAIISDARLDTRAPSQVVTERLLSISGEDSVDVNRKHRDHWTGQLGVRFLILTNELPRLSDVSGALASRFVILTLQQSFIGREDLGLANKLLMELPGIVNWSLEGLHRLYKRGHFIMPQTSLDAVRTLEDLSSPIGAFLREWCMIGQGTKIKVRKLYDAYTKWCQLEGHHASSHIVFGRNLVAAVPQMRTEGRYPDRHYVGVALSLEGEDAYQESIRFNSEK